MPYAVEKKNESTFARMHPVSPTHPGKVFGRFSGKDRKSLGGRLFPQSSETISID
ncbi:MAG: hypothetical protein IT569_09385 [Leptospiraceae bacterium]|nr:hypothetical protein [Leptospiraceae bacterium]